MARTAATLVAVVAITVAGCGGEQSSAAVEACQHGRDAVSSIQARDFDPVPGYLRAMTESANRSDLPGLRQAAQDVREKYVNWSNQTAGTTDAQFASKAIAEALSALDTECADVGAPIDQAEE